jgi:phosphoglycolate phosphatase-like HAD superfamily hydrolase
MANSVVFFDIGGTLLCSPDIFQIITLRLTGRWPNEPTYNLVLKNFMEIVEPIQKGRAGLPFRNIVELHKTALVILADRYGYRNISAEAQEICVDTYVHQSSFFPEAEAVLEKLKRHHVKMVIASDNDNLGFSIQIPKFGLSKYFSGYCISEIARAYKPNPGFIADLKQYIPTGSGNNCYFVGDSWVDVESGKRLGIKSVLIDRKKNADSLGADYVIRDLNELLAILNIRE